jgi:hypothetical protein
LIRRLLTAGGALLLACSLPAHAAGAVAHRQLTVAGVEAHVLTVSPGADVRPLAHRPGRTVPAWAKGSGAIAAINGGYFNHSDGWPVSHVMADGRALTDPERNRALLANPALKPVLPVIFNHRPEWRVLQGPFGCRWAFAPHDAAVPVGTTVRDALQAGPTLLPTLDLAGEAFVLQDARGRITRDGIGAMGRAARSAIGLTPKGELLMVAVAGSTRRGTGVTIAQLAGLMRQLGASEAIALDGGSSTTLSWQEGGRWHTFVGSGEGAALVNSVLIVK